VQATDGDVGTVSELYFDDQKWAISHLGISTDVSERDRPVILSPSIIRPHWDVATVPATVSRNEIFDRAALDGARLRGSIASSSEGHERSIGVLTGLHIKATDGEIGHVDDLLIDEDSWQIGYLVVDTSNWIGGKWVAISPSVLRGINWSEGTVDVAVSRDVIKGSPEMESLPVPPAETMPPFVLL
jgi:hypothetical protein